MINEPISQQICALVIAGNILNSGSAAVPVPGRKPQLRIRLPGSFKLAHLNRIQSFLMLSITPVLFLLWQVKISADRPICWLSESEAHLLHSSNPWEYINTFFFAVLIILPSKISDKDSPDPACLSFYWKVHHFVPFRLNYYSYILFLWSN